MINGVDTFPISKPRLLVCLSCWTLDSKQWILNDERWKGCWLLSLRRHERRRRFCVILANLRFGVQPASRTRFRGANRGSRVVNLGSLNTGAWIEIYMVLDASGETGAVHNHGPCLHQLRQCHKLWIYIDPSGTHAPLWTHPTIVICSIGEFNTVYSIDQWPWCSLFTGVLMLSSSEIIGLHIHIGCMLTQRTQRPTAKVVELSFPLSARDYELLVSPQKAFAFRHNYWTFTT